MMVQPHQPVRREVNEQVRVLPARFELREPETILALCECAQHDCTRRLEIPLDAYDAVRREPTRFIVGDGHVGALGTVVERHAGWVVVQS
jgi:hypothetical protein